MLLHIVHIVVDLHQTLVRDGQRAGRSVLDTAVEHHLDDGILDDLGIDVEVGHVLVGTQGTENGIGR